MESIRIFLAIGGVNSIPVKNVVEQVTKHGWLHSFVLLGKSVCTSASLVGSLNLTLTTTIIKTGYEKGHSFRDEKDWSTEAGDTQWLDSCPNAHTR